MPAHLDPENFGAPAGIVDPESCGVDLPWERFRRRRERLVEQIGDGVLILPAAPQLFTSRDTEVRFRQDSDFFYLTGFREPSAVVVITPHDPEHRFTLFVRPRDPEREQWSGGRGGVEGAKAVYRADAAYPIGELGEHLESLVARADRILYPLGGDREMDDRVIGLISHFRRARQRSGRGPDTVVDPASVLAAMRLIKEPCEIEQIRAAAEITVAAHHAAILGAGVGVGEWEIEATLLHTFRGRGADGAAFPPIVASGPNTTILHYIENNRRGRNGELMLIDAGAAVGMYAADISRTFPVNGRFSAAQRAIYEVVLEAEEAAIAAVRPSSSASDPHEAALRVLVAGMIELELLEGEVEALIEDEAYKRFFPHQTSHWLGLDVHDVGLYKEEDSPVPLRAGMVLTVEPGLYIPHDAENVPETLRGIGVRIEDDVLVTTEGHEVLTRGIPVAVDEVEALVGMQNEECRMQK